MKDFYFLTGMLIGVAVGGIIVYKSKMAKTMMCKCENEIMDVAKKTKEKMNKDKKEQEKKAN